MSEEEILTKYIELINKGYCCGCNELNCIDNFPHKKIANAISNLQQENTQLKEELKYTVPIVEYNKIVSEKNKEINQLKSVLKEIREYIKEHENESIYLDCKLYETKVYNDLLEKIDKAGIGEHNG